MLSVSTISITKEHRNMPSAQLNNGLPLDAKQILDFPIYRPENAPTPYHRRTAINMEPDLGLNWAEAIYSPSGPMAHNGQFLSTIFRHCPKSFFEQTARVWRRAHQQFISSDFRLALNPRGIDRTEIDLIRRISTLRIFGSKLDILLDLKRFIAEVHAVVCQQRNVTELDEHIPAAVMLSRYTAINYLRTVLSDNHDRHPRWVLDEVRENTFPGLRATLATEMARSDDQSWLFNRRLGFPHSNWHGLKPLDRFSRIIRRMVIGDNWQDILSGSVQGGTFTFYPNNDTSHENIAEMEAICHSTATFFQELSNLVDANNQLLEAGLEQTELRLPLLRDLDVNEVLGLGSIERNRLVIPVIRANPVIAPEPPKNPLDDLAPEPKLIETTPQALIDVCTCPITYEIMRDPVIDPEGNSFERLAIISALKKNPRSPITRTPLDHKKLVENRALKQTIQALTASS